MISLRTAEPADGEILYEHQADPIAAEMAAFPSRDRTTYLDHWQNVVLANPRGITRIVLVDGVVAGNVVSWVDPELGRLLGYWLGREFWGRGVATAAVSAYLSEVRDRPIHAFVAAHNIGSQRVLEKNGFVRVAEEPHVAEDGIAEFLYVLN